MYLHLINDVKFVDYVVEQFEAVDSNNHEYIFVSSGNTDRNLIKNKEIIKFINLESMNIEKIIQGLSKYEAIFLHYLDHYKIEILKNAGDNLIFIWMMWGGDFYNRIITNKYKYFDFQTIRIHYRFQSKNLIHYWLKLFGLDYLKNILKVNENNYWYLNKITFFSSVIPNEKYIVGKYLSPKAKYLNFNYGSLEGLFDNDEDNYCVKGDAILVGNSADSMNNHLPIVSYLSKLKLNNRKIILPLSYGIEKHYLDYLLNYCNSKLGANFNPINELLTKQNYLELISQCSVVIMNHYRQQGLGNILISIWMGAKVFISQKSPLFTFLKELGIVIYSVEKDLYKNKTALKKLDITHQVLNRKILKSYYTQNIVLSRTRKLIEDIRNFKN